ncbi:hypothetical protein BDP27DRAFT_1215348 [Rhodocollybia butyracea]|uniref:Anaphase-promoting complex subunit 1 n=1 Tax=Rhodocollybia butyracea TaxID=206335 RepID=A0A9P5UC79_9AGAR|nr:hypothetical protein BDP27DRAFT_1215348 [Rhodocollybia butyracea]
MAQFDPLPLRLFRRYKSTLPNSIENPSINNNPFVRPKESPKESPLLQAIKSALRGTGVAPPSTIHTSCVHTDGNDGEEQELTWTDTHVILTIGGAPKRKWSFELEGQPVQWACIGWMEESGTFPPKHFAERQDSASKSPSERPTFGPFFYANQKSGPPSSKRDGRTSAVFVFLRSIGKIFLDSGLEHTFSLPFIVRKAWPVTPHGLIVQRVLEPAELVEAELAGEDVLPTIFSLSNPFAEPSAVGLTSGIIGNPGHGLATLKDEDENSTKPLKPISPYELILWTSHKAPNSPHEIVATLDSSKRRLTIWRYVYIKPKDSPVPLGRKRAKSLAHKKRQSMTANNRRTSAAFPDMFDKLHPTSPGPPSPTRPSFPELAELPPLSKLPGMAPSLSTTTTMASLGSGSNFNAASQPNSQSQPEQSSTTTKVRRNSLTRNDLSVTMNRMILGSRGDMDVLTPMEHGRMKTTLWMDKLIEIELDDQGDVEDPGGIMFSLFDHRKIDKLERSLLAVCLPSKQTVMVYQLAPNAENQIEITTVKQIPAVASAIFRGTRFNIWDLIVVKPDGKLSLFTHGTYEIALSAVVPNDPYTYPPKPTPEVVSIVSEACTPDLTAFLMSDGRTTYTASNYYALDTLTAHALQVLALCLPSDTCFLLHRHFLQNWAWQSFNVIHGVEFECFTAALYAVFGLDSGYVDHNDLPAPSSTNPWDNLYSISASSRTRFRDDPAMKLLHEPSDRIPPSARIPPAKVLATMQKGTEPYNQLVVALYTLHTLAEQLRLIVDQYSQLLKLAPVICRIAMYIRPEWADYWRRMCPDAMVELPWPSSATADLDDTIPVWPPDISAILYGRISNPEWKVPWFDALELASRFRITPSFAYGIADPLDAMKRLTLVYMKLADPEIKRHSKRAENAVKQMVRTELGEEFIERLPLGIAAPLREAIRTCQMAPPPDWPMEAYNAIGRGDVRASVSAIRAEEKMPKNGYRSVKEYLTSSHPRKTIGQIAADAKSACLGESEPTTGVELELDEFTNIRFGQDRRLEEIARMLCSSAISSARSLERPDATEHDQAKDHQMQVIRIAERTLALPYGRAMFTFGSVSSISREAFIIPKIEFSVKLHPSGGIVSPDPGKIMPESVHWGEFHNGVAAALRISSSSASVDSSWIAFNKPSELTPEHAGFLFGLGLTGHLKEMLTWHTFGYLTPKHDLTSIGVLLGLSAANIGNGNQHVTKLLAVHTPALLPTPSVDLNVPLHTQAAGLTGVGLLYIGTKNRRMAEVCLTQMNRKDLVQPDLSNEYREAYTYSAALAFGMVMLGKGTTIPADVALLERLNVLIHGDGDFGSSRSSFDINLTSPAASVALGLMYLRTERQDIADILSIPDTILGLNRIQPSFLLLRTLGRVLIMWNKITPTNDWVSMQIPEAIRKGMEMKQKSPTGSSTVADAWELAYYNIIAGCCFAIGLKYAGTARQEAYKMIIRYHDLFTRMVYSNGPSFDWRIKRSAVRDGLNLITVSLSMVMAGTGEITCLRRLRYAYGMYGTTMYHPAFKYGIHVSTHQALGLLFLGGGRFTLGTSDAAIACMVAAFFPRTHSISADNKSYLQALRHLWVLAVEPRCLVVRDIETKEVVYLPVKITMREGKAVGTTQLISPTLIPDLNKLISIRVDTPRYWPFYLDTEKIPHHKESLMRSQTLYVKRRTAFLSYTEDPRGSRSLFVRSRSSAGDAATLDYPQFNHAKTHPAGDLWEFITSSSNDPLFLAFADYFCCRDGQTEKEQILRAYCHAVLFDSILQGKPQTLQSHLTLFRYRNMSSASRYFHLHLQDLRFLADFYGRVFERRFSGRTENNHRTPLLRDTTVWATLHDVDERLEVIRSSPEFICVLGLYSLGKAGLLSGKNASHLAWYLLRNAVPVSTLLLILKELAAEAHAQCLNTPPPAGTSDSKVLDLSIKEVLHSTGSRMTTALGAGWSVRSLDEIIEAWKIIA